MLERFGRAASVTPRVHRLFEQLRAIAPEHYPVVLRGEFASGRETLAQAMHESARPGSPCVVVDLASIPMTLVESVLFGYVKEAFTGHVTIRRGPFEEAESGTVILRELGALHEELQPKLLRLVRERRFERVGDTTMRPFNGRLIATTSRDLDKLQDLGWLRTDLRQEIARIEIEVPPLRERLADLPLLLAAASPDQIARLSRLSWRGNFSRWNAFVAAFARDPAAAVTEAELLEAIEAAPDDDGPRLVYADALTTRGDLRGDWINLQVRHALSPDDRKIAAAEKKLRETHYQAFANPVLSIGTTPVSTPSVKFARGFVDTLVIDGEALRNFDAILAAAPLLQRVVTSGHLDTCVWTSPGLRVVSDLEVTSRLDALVIQTIARCPYLTGLRSLTLTGEPVLGTPSEGQRLDFEQLARSPHLGGVSRLTLRGYPLEPVNLATLFGDSAAWTLTELVTDAAMSPAHVAMLCAAPKARALITLRVSQLGPESREILANSQVLTGTSIYVDNQVLR